MKMPEQAPPIADYALLSDCRASALVSRYGSVDWCCMPRFDAAPCFGRLLDWRLGGYCSIAPVAQHFEGDRSYLEDTLVLCTTVRTEGGTAHIYDFLAMSEPGSGSDWQRLVRIVEGGAGVTDLKVEIAPRFDFGHIAPWVRAYEDGVFTALGGSHGLVLSGDLGLRRQGNHSLEANIRVREGERKRFAIQFARPELLEEGPVAVPTPTDLDRDLTATTEWWRQWSERLDPDKVNVSLGVKRAAITLKGLSYLPTGAIIAAPTTSLPEGLQGTRTWDYRFSWIRDAAFTADVMVKLGCDEEAFGFRRFIERSSAGSAEEFQTLYGIDGSRRQSEQELKRLEGYRGATPVREGNQASQQLQLDVFGEMLELAWVWHTHGHSPDRDYWRFLVDLVDRVAGIWHEPDHGIWEMRGEPQHFVHSKVMCWMALDRGIRLAKELDRQAPIDKWKQARGDIRAAVERHGYDDRTGVFIQAFGRHYLDAALLRLPRTGFISYDNPRMIRTTDAVRERLDVAGLLLRYDCPDGLPGREGAFLACSFWLVECLAGQRRFDEAQQVFDRAASTANDLGLFSEEYDYDQEQLLANFPQGLTQLSYVSAGLALSNGAPFSESKPARAGSR